MNFRQFGCYLLGFGSLLFFGCDKPLSPEVAAWRKEFLCATKPSDPLSLTDAKGKLQQESDITVVGKVGSGKLDPFVKGRAQFVLSEAPASGHGDEKDHDATECIYCRRRLADAPLAVVELHDATGKVIPLAANETLGISDGQRLVIQGRGKYDPELNSIAIVAKQVFVEIRK
jgi:hypothetical protein